MRPPASLKDEYLAAMKADHIPGAWSNLWWVEKVHMPHAGYGNRNGHFTRLEAGDYTYLRRLTDSTLYDMRPGEVVMEDTPFELRTHLGFVMNAYGKVLVTGLGLGCVVRGLLKNPRVDHVTCIENSTDVLNLVGQHMQVERLTVVEADALQWTAQNTDRFDCAWHDLWTNRDSGEPHLDVWHQRLFENCHKHVKRQGAWAFNRGLKSYLLRRNFPWVG
jgi:hypothetical protein